MKKYEILLFDLDDTLVDNMENIRYAYKKILETKSIDYDDYKFDNWANFDKNYWHSFYENKLDIPDEYRINEQCFIEYLRSKRFYDYFKNITMEEAISLNNIYIEALNEIVIPVEGAFETLEYLSKKYRIIIATNGPSLAVNSKLSKINCLDFIECVFSSDMTKSTIVKPSLKYFEDMQEYYNLYDKDKMLMIGDSLKSDIELGMNAGIDTCWFNSNNEVMDSKHTSTYIINKLIDLKEIL